MNTKHFGEYGGRYVPEMVIPALDELCREYDKAKKDPKFHQELRSLYRTYTGRPTPLTFAENLTRQLGGAKIYLKNEGLNLTGAHKITHCIGQALIAKRLGKTRLIAETGAGQHGVATATVAAKFGMGCTIYMGAVDIERQRPNVFSMQQLGAEVISVEDGSRTLKDAVSAAFKDYAATSASTHYVIGSALGPDPYPRMNRDFQSVIGQEVRSQLKRAEGKLPDVLIACVGGGSNSLGLFSPFMNNASVRMIGVEAGGSGKKIGEHASRFLGGKPAVIQGYKSYFLIEDELRISQTHSIAAGLDYPGIGPELAHLKETGRIEFTTASDQEALEAVHILMRAEGIFPALESAHAVAKALKLVPTLSPKQIVVVNISGRGDKDIFTLARAFDDVNFYTFLENEVRRPYEYYN